MKENLEILRNLVYVVIATGGIIFALYKWAYKKIQNKALQENKLNSADRIENDLKVLYKKDNYHQFRSQHPVRYYFCFVWFAHLAYISWRKLICYFKQEKDA